MKPKQIVDRWHRMKSSRSLWESHWQQCADYVIPRKADITVKRTQGDKRNVDLYDSTASQSAELLAGALHGMLTNPASYWFELTTGDDVIDAKDDVRLFLQDVQIKMHSVLNNSNFQTEVHELYLDQIWAGTGCFAIEEDPQTVVRFAERHIAEICIEENNRGLIDTVYRLFEWSAKQIVQEFGFEACSKKVQEAFEKDPQLKFKVIHAVQPRELKEEDKEKFGPKFYPYESYYVLVDELHELSEGGFREFPYAVPRWTKSSGEFYGRSPTMKALPDIKMINEMMKTTLKAAQKMVDPPLMVPDDGFVLPLKTTPGGLNYYRSGSTDRIETFGDNARVDFGYQVMEDVRKRIREAFYVDQLQLAQGPQMTATEVLQRTEEKLKLMGPMLGRQQSEFLRPMIDRVFNIMLRRKMLPPPPEALREVNGKIEVKYSSLVAKAQRVAEGNNIVRAIQTIAPFVQMDPMVTDNFNGDEAVRIIASVYGIPQKMIRDQRSIKQMREGRAQAQQEAMQMEKESRAADVVSKVGQVAVQNKAVEQQ